jgi:hypothetical protein
MHDYPDAEDPNPNPNPIPIPKPRSPGDRLAIASRSCACISSAAAESPSLLAWSSLTQLPCQDVRPFDEVTTHVNKEGQAGKVAIVTYGNGVVTAMQARKVLEEEHGMEGVFDIIDTPLISAVPGELPAALSTYEAVVFADICKEGQSPLAQMCVQLHSMEVRIPSHPRRFKLCLLQALPAKWRVLAAPKTYNPLGSVSLVSYLVSDPSHAAGALFPSPMWKMW